MTKVINVISDTNIGGAGRWLLALLDNYDKSEFDIEVFIPDGSLLKQELIDRSTAFTEVSHINDKSLDLKAVISLYRLFREKQPDVVHTHAAFSARIAARLYGRCRIIHTRHSVFTQAEYKKSFPYKQVFGGINNLLSDDIIAVSPAASDNMTEIGTDYKKIKIIYNGIQPVRRTSEAEQEQTRQRFGLSDNDFVIGIIARVETVKGHDYLLDAMKLNDDPDVKLLIVGTGSDEGHLRQRVRDEKIRNVIFAGFIKNVEQVENIIDVVVNASVGTEATSLALLEAMSLGIPAVASDFGGNPYVIKHGVNGFIVPQRNPEELYNAVMTLKNDSRLYAKMSGNAYLVFDKSFKADAMAKNICKLYTKERRA